MEKIAEAGFSLVIMLVGIVALLVLIVDGPVWIPGFAVGMLIGLGIVGVIKQCV